MNEKEKLLELEEKLKSVWQKSNEERMMVEAASEHINKLILIIGELNIE